MHIQIFKGGQDLLALHQHHPSRYPFLLESVSVSADARFSLLFAFPQEILRLNNLGEESFCGRLDSMRKEPPLDFSLSATEKELPFRGGWFLYLGYELAGQLEPTLKLPAEESGLPLALAIRIPSAVIVDHHRAETIILAEQGFEQSFSQMLEDIAAMQNLVPPQAISTAEIYVSLSEDEPQQFTDGVGRIREYIAAGDVFQVNLSRAWRAELTSGRTPVDIYHRLRKSNPAPFACFADFGEFALLSSSPERLARVRDGEIDTRPIAGTRPRGDNPTQDRNLLDELIAHPKERAEHIMLIDLERNDLGRLCEYGTVEVNELMVVESYQHVHHIVSNIRGRLRAGITPGQIIRAVFPGGTITGCPKIRCMEIIAELEKKGRGAYTGSVGYLNHNGDMDLNILIRSMIWRDGVLTFRTGAGIVIDSRQENELAETRHKARGLLRALGHDSA